jgi:hypothetical protein
MSKEWDVFVSHASEDKESFVRPLAQALAQLGVKVWYDEFTLEIGDSLSKSIDKGLANSTYGIVVISHSFIRKKWPERELKGLVAREIEQEQKVILPIWLGVTKQEVLNFSPPLADTLAIPTEGKTAEEIALILLKTLRPDIYTKHPRAELERLVTGQALRSLQEELDNVKNELAEYRCSYCGAPLSERMILPDDPELYGGGLGDEFDCGHRTIEGHLIIPCPSDPRFPKLDEYEFVTEHNRNDPHAPCTVYLQPKTENAARIRFDGEVGKSEQQAKDRLIACYNKRAEKWKRNRDWGDLLAQF